MDHGADMARGFSSPFEIDDGGPVGNGLDQDRRNCCRHPRQYLRGRQPHRALCGMPVHIARGRCRPTFRDRPRHEFTEHRFHGRPQRGEQTADTRGGEFFPAVIIFHCRTAEQVQAPLGTGGGDIQEAHILILLLLVVALLHIAIDRVGFFGRARLANRRKQ